MSDLPSFIGILDNWFVVTSPGSLTVVKELELNGFELSCALASTGSFWSYKSAESKHFSTLYEIPLNLWGLARIARSTES